MFDEVGGFETWGTLKKSKVLGPSLWIFFSLFFFILQLTP